MGRRFYEHGFCIVLGSIVNELLDHPFGDNLSHTADSLQKKRVRRFRNYIDCSMIVHRFGVHVSFILMIWASFINIFDIEFGIDFDRFKSQTGSQNLPYRYPFRLKNKLWDLTLSYGSRPGTDLGATCGPKRSQPTFS